MPVHLRLSPDLDTDEVYEFLQSADPEIVVDDDRREILEDAALEEATTRHIAEFRERDGGNLRELYSAERRTCLIVAPVGDDNYPAPTRSHITYHIPVRHPIRIDLHASLIVPSTIDPNHRRILEHAFAGYSPADDPVALADRLYEDHGIDPKGYHVVGFVTLEKTGPSTPDLRVEHALRNSLPEGSGLRCQATPVNRAPDPEEDSVREYPPEEDRVDVYERISNELRDRLPCEGFRPDDKRIGTLAAWPEFRIKWVKKKTPCGRIRWPELQWRVTSKVAHAVVFNPPELDSHVHDIVKHCLGKAASDPVVWAATLVSIAGGLKMFGALFADCMEDQMLGSVACLVPEVTIRTEHSRWGLH